MRVRILSISLALLASILASRCPAQAGLTGVYDSWNDVNLAGLVSLNGNATYSVTDFQVNVSVDSNNVPDGINVTAEIHGAVTADLKALPQVSGPIDVWLPLAAIVLPPIQFGADVLVFPVAGAFAHISGNVATDARIGLMQNFEMTVSASLTAASGLTGGLVGTPRVAQKVAPPNEAALNVTVEIVAGFSFQVIYIAGGLPVPLGGPAFIADFTIHAVVDLLADPWWAADASVDLRISYLYVTFDELLSTSVYSQQFFVDDAGGPLLPNSLPPSRWSRALDLGGDEDATAVVPLADGLFVIANTGLGNLPYLAKLNWDGTPVFEKRGQLIAGASFRPLDATTASNGDILVCGHTATSGGARVDRFTTSGTPIWSKILVPPGSLIGINDIVATDDGGAIVAGSITHLATAVGHPLAARLDQAGALVWMKEFDFGPAVPNAKFSTVISTSDGGFLFAGRVDYQDAPVAFATLYGANLLAVKVDANLAVQFTTTIGTIYWDEIYGACQGDDGTYVLAGTIGHNTHAGWLVGLDAAGNEIWSRSIAGQSISGSAGNTAYDTINSIVAVDGGYVVSGFTGLANGTRDAWIIGVDWDGVTTFFKSFRAAHNDELAGIALLSDGYIAYGATHSLGAGASPLRDLWLVRTAVDGYLDFTPQSGFDAFNDRADWTNTSHVQLPLPCTLLDVSPTVTSGVQSYTPVTATVTVLTP